MGVDDEERANLIDSVPSYQEAVQINNQRNLIERFKLKFWVKFVTKNLLYIL